MFSFVVVTVEIFECSSPHSLLYIHLAHLPKRLSTHGQGYYEFRQPKFHIWSRHNAIGILVVFTLFLEVSVDWGYKSCFMWTRVLPLLTIFLLFMKVTQLLAD